MWTLYEGDCFDYLPLIEDKSVDMVLCDLPYGTTACKWDTPLPLDKLWSEYERVIKDNGAIVLTGSQPFTSHLVMSNPKLFKYSWVWQKEQGTGFQLVKYRPLIEHEDVLVFSKTSPKYSPQMEKREAPIKQVRKGNNRGSSSSPLKYSDHRVSIYTERYPTSIKRFIRDKGLHPTQKPVPLFEYLIKTYTNPGDVVLDNCAGSGTTGVACENTGRNSILMEKEPEYCNIIRNRLNELSSQTRLKVEA